MGETQPQTEPAAAPASTPSKRSLLRRVLRKTIAILATSVIVCAGVWSVAALALSGLHGAPPRVGFPILFAVAFLCVLIFIRPHRRAQLIAAVMTIAVIGWYHTIRPSNDRDWAPGARKLVTATIDGDRITLHNYRTLDRESDGTEQIAYTDQTYNLSDLQAVDFIMSFWGPNAIGHALVSFEFADGRHVAMSIEVRKEEAEKGFDALRSAFRNFELIYVVGDERALIGPGTIDGRHQIYLYPTTTSPDRTRALFMKYIESMNDLQHTPVWYNAITDNCTTAIYMKLRQIPPPPPFSITVLVNGYLPEYVYEHRALDSEMPWPELHRRCNITEAGRKAYDSPDFSRLIRHDIPYPASRKRVD